MNLKLNVFSGRVVLVFAACCAGAAFAHDAALGVHAMSLLTTNVAAGATGTLAEDVGLTERTTFLKTGEGTLNVPASAAGLTPLSVQAAEGTLAFENDQPSAKRILDGRKLESRNVRLGAYGFGESFLHDATHAAELAECRLDFVAGVQGSDSATLKLLREKGIKTMASGVVSAWGGTASAGDMAAAFSLSSYEQQLAAYTAHTVNPAIFCLALSDEPHASAFDHLGQVVELIDRTVPETPAYVNLYPNYASNTQNTPEEQVSQLGTATYQEYIDQYCQKVPTKYISYDHYPIRDNAAWMMETGIPRMYENYRIVAEACRSNNREFWYIAQLNTAPDNNQKTSLDQLRYQAWTAMAHGAVSIAWACWGKGWWTNNVYDNSVRDNDQFANLKTVNAEIKRVGAHYMAFRNTATRFVDFGASYASDAAQGAFGAVAADDRSPILVGEMTAREGNAEAIFVVAAGNPTNGVAATHTVRVTAAGAIAAFGPGGPIALTPAGDDTYTFALRDNDCALVTKDYVDETAGLDELPTLSEAVQNKLAFWGSVKDTAHLEMNFGGTLAKWYDVRETNPESPKFIHLATVVTNYSESDTSTGPTIQEGSYVCKYSSETNRQRMAYFGGYGSGKTMRFVGTDGKAYMKRPMELSSVYGFTGGDFGFLFGNCKLTGEHRLWNEGSGLPWASVWGSVAGDTQIWIDGEKVDRAIGTLPKGFHALHTRVNTLTTEELSIFENALFSIHHNKGNRGGQYVGEVMFFTNRLTYAERGEVQRYMNRKWFGHKPSTVKATLESGAELDVVAAGAFPTLADLQVTGDGRFVKQGDGTLLYRPTAFDSAPAPIVEIAGGAVSANRSLAVALTAGQKVTAVNPANPTAAAEIGTTLTVDAAAAGTVEKAGLGYAEINSIPAGTKKLNVAGGVLALKPTCAPVRRYEVAIPNGDFSDYWKDNDDRGNVAVTNCAGWSQTGTSVGFYNYDVWMAGKNGGPFGATVTIKAFGFDVCPPPDGKCVLMIKMLGSSARVAGIEIPEPGEYELSYLLTARDASSNMARIHNYLTDSDNQTLDLGLAYTTTIKDWTDQKTFRFFVAKPGTYTLHFDLLAKWRSDQPANGDATVLFNSLHLYRVGDQAHAYKIPGGDFEEVSGTDADGLILRLDGSATVAGWTFDTTVDSTYCRAGVTDFRTYTETGRRNGSGFNCSHHPLGGEHQFLIRRAGGWATTTFTPPAGRWYLKAHAALWGEYSTSSGGPRVNAMVVENNGTVTNDLGALALPQSWTMQPYVWATPFEVGTNTEVTLTVTFNGHTGLRGVHLDDFMLVRDYEHPYEIVQNGDFERPAFDDRANPGVRTGWTGVATRVPDGVDDKGNPKTKTLGDNISREYGRDNWAFGTDYGSGNCFMEPYNNGGVGGFYQDVTFPHAGWYRLSYLAKTRANAGNTSSAVEVSLVDVATGATNRIDVVDQLAKGVYSQQTALFRVDGPVTRRLLFLCARSGAYPAFDDISIRYVGERVPDVLASPDEASIKANGLEVSLAAGAYLKLDYPGTNRITRLFVDGVRQDYGVYNAANCPFIVGAGTLLSQPRKSGGAIWFR